MTSNHDLYQRGLRVMPGGVNSPVRAFRSVGGTPNFIAEGHGAYVTDVEGAVFLDYVQSYGASIVGHAHPKVIATIEAAAKRGTTFGAPTEGEVRLAETMVGRIDGLEQLRLVSSGTEATMSALRLARGATGRNKIVKFVGNYHGHSDALLASSGSGVIEGFDLGETSTPDSAGVTPGSIADTVVAPYNVVPTLDETVAVVVVEPVAANMGLIAPRDGFLEGLRDECNRVGALLMFDEVICGFRLAFGGATEFLSVTPDIWCFGKVIGGGLPVGAYGASTELMSHISPLGPVYQAGTLSGNPLATAAGLAVLELLTPDAYSQLEDTAEALADGLHRAFSDAGIEARVPRVGPLVGVFFGSDLPVDFESARASVSLGLYPQFFHGMLDAGIALAPGPYEVMFPSLAHRPEDIARTAEAAAQVAVRMAEGSI